MSQFNNMIGYYISTIDINCDIYDIFLVVFLSSKYLWDSHPQA